MLVKVTGLTFDSMWNSATQSYDWKQIDGGRVTYINPDRLAFLELDPEQYPGYARARLLSSYIVISHDDALKLIAAHNGESAPQIDAPVSKAESAPGIAPAPAVAPNPAIADDDRTVDRVRESLINDLDAIYDARDNFCAVIESNDFVVLDTETTGLQNFDEICQIAIIDATGEPLLNTLVKPTIAIPAAATRIHGINNHMVENAPSWEHIAGRVAEILNGRNVIIYNAEYDTRMMDQSAYAAGLPRPEWSGTRFHCAMLIFAAIKGDWNERYQNYKWQSLDTAAAYYRIASVDTHTAYGDCVTTLAVCQAIANGGALRF